MCRLEDEIQGADGIGRFVCRLINGLAGEEEMLLVPTTSLPARATATATTTRLNGR